MSSDNESKELPKIVVDEPNATNKQENDKQEDNDINVLSGDNKIDVGIKPDVKSNDVYLQLCSCSLVFNCFTRDSTAKNSD
jgi:hypothetical protein